MFGKRPRFNSQKNNHANRKQEALSPLCPKCGDEMVKRTAKKGLNARNQFWGCITFPECKGMMRV